MPVDPIRTNQVPAVPSAPPAQAARVRPQSDPATSASRSSQPVLVAATPPPDVKVQWDVDNGVVLKFTDKRSGEVVQQIPSEQVLSVVRFIRQLLEDDEAASTNNGKAASERNHG